MVGTNGEEGFALAKLPQDRIWSMLMAQYFAEIGSSYICSARDSTAEAPPVTSPLAVPPDIQSD